MKGDGAVTRAAKADTVVVIDGPEASGEHVELLTELRNIAHDLRGTAWSTEGLLRLLYDDWEARDDEERRRILKLALSQAGALQKLPARLERVYRTKPATAERS